MLERYYQGADQRWGTSLGEVSFDANTLHDLRSVTKSVVSLLYGIALDRGLVPPPDASLIAQFPEHADLASGPRHTRLTVAHALTMTLGTAWDETRPYSNLENDEVAMENAPDRYRFILERPFVAEPGARWIYSGGAVALIGALIERGSGRTLSEFAQEVLFDPLGISEFDWITGSDGVASSASGLRLRARDLMEIGRLVLARGELAGHRIISESWLDVSSQAAISTDDGLDYGHLWFLGSAPVPAFSGLRPWMAGFGNGGQRLWLMPAADVAVVIFSGNYNAPDAWVSPARIWREIVLANLQSA